MSNQTRKRLGDIVNFKRGYDLPAYNRKEGEYPIISSGGISGYHSEFKKDGEGLITGRYGTLGEMYYINGKYWPHNTALYATDFKGNYPKYVYYLMKCLGNLKTSDKSAVPGVNRNELHEIIVPYIYPDYQRDIADFLYLIDSKIALNNRINAELEAMAKTMYDYWFVQFEFPVSAPIEGATPSRTLNNQHTQGYKSSGGKMVWSDELKREVPEGWEVKTINQIIEVKDGTHDSPKPKSEGYRLITSKNLLPSGLDFESANFISEEDYININKRSKVDTGDILFSMIGSIGVVYKVEDEEINFAVKNVALYKTSQKPDYKNYIYQYLKSYDMEKYMGNVISGSIQKFISLGSLRNMPLLINDDIILKFQKATEHLFIQLENNKKQNQQLSSLRDWLLPMLMNGQVKVQPLTSASGRTGSEGEQEKEWSGMMAAEPGSEYKRGKKMQT